jgi:hypothetical protein
MYGTALHHRKFGDYWMPAIVGMTIVKMAAA